jgi:SAM-dependent methyltransferase
MPELERNVDAVIDYLKALGLTRILIEPGAGAARPDLVVYSDPLLTRPWIVAEIKRQLPPKVELLHPAVQQAFRYSVLLGNTEGFLLVSDGEHHHWFRLKDDGGSLEFTTPPAIRPQEGTLPRGIGAAEFELRIALRHALSKIRDFGIRVDIRTVRDLLRVLATARLNPGRARTLATQSTDRVSSATRRVLEEVGGPGLRLTADWVLDDSLVAECLRSFTRADLEPLFPAYTPRVFWAEVGQLLVESDHIWLSPSALARFLIGVTQPTSHERLIDPACGTGQFLVEAYLFRNPEPASKRAEDTQNLIGFERNEAVAEIAQLNLLIAGLSAASVRFEDSLLYFADSSRDLGKFDVVVTDPPVGRMGPQYAGSAADLYRSPDKIETAFVEQAVRLLRTGGRAALLLPESFFFAQDRREFRDWLLRNVQIQAVISLPAGAWTTARSHTQASVLIFSKNELAHTREYSLFVADLRAGRANEPGSDLHLSDQLEQTRSAFLAFLSAPTGLRDGRGTEGAVVSSTAISGDRLDVPGILIESWRRSPSRIQTSYPIARLDDVADLLSGKHIRSAEQNVEDYATYIQAGHVRRFVLRAADAPRLSREQYDIAERARVSGRDVLITTTGQYIGRAAVVNENELPAIASSAVTIVRVRNPSQIDPRYLAAFLNSPAGVEQFEQRRIKGVAQPYIRKSEIGGIAIPVPPIEIQRQAADEIWLLLSKADAMVAEAAELRARAHRMLVDRLTEGEQRE